MAQITPREVRSTPNVLTSRQQQVLAGTVDHAGLNLQTHSFELREVEILVAAMAERFGIRSRTRANKGGWVIYVPASDVGALRSVIEPHILPELRYKLVPRRERTP